MKTIIWITAIVGLMAFTNPSDKTILEKEKSNINNETYLPHLISAEGQNASGPYFTTNHKGKPILVWTEALPKIGEDEDAKTDHVIKFAELSNESTTFNKPVVVESSKGCRAHDESMSKIAFKNDGTIIAVFSKRTPHKDNRFAGALFYTQSFDEGKSWTKANYLHVGDTTLGLSRSFFDLATLPDGEVGAIWLDSRLTEKRGDGSTMFFAKTENKQGFISDKPIAYRTCECCRTDLLVDTQSNTLHVAYRDIIQDTIRDMVHLLSADNGETFTEPKRISADNWMINGCPHTGPSMSIAEEKVNFVWYTLGGGEGLYYNFMDKENTFSARQLITTKGKHPQMLTMANGQLVFVWEESESQAHLQNHETAHTQPSNIKTEQANKTVFIKAQVWQNNAPLYEHWVSQPNFIAEFPVVTAIDGEHVGIAWVQNNVENGFGVYFKQLKL